MKFTQSKYLGVRIFLLILNYSQNKRETVWKVGHFDSFQVKKNKYSYILHNAYIWILEVKQPKYYKCLQNKWWETFQIKWNLNKRPCHPYWLSLDVSWELRWDVKQLCACVCDGTSYICRCVCIIQHNFLFRLRPQQFT